MSVPASPLTMPKPRLRWFQYSLRSLLLAMLAASLGMSWVAVKMQKARRQKEAVEAILKFGGTVEYDYQQNTSGKRIRGALPPTATWWRNLLGNNFFDSVIEIQVLSDAALEHVEQLPDLPSLRLGCRSKVTNAGMVHVRGLSKLRKLWFGVTSVTDAGLAHLSALHQLESLQMAYLHTTGASLQHLQGLTQLQELVLSEGQKTDAGLVYLKGLTRLRHLSLSGGQVTDAGLEYLKELTQLERLSLDDTKVTVQGVKNLRQTLPSCEIIWRPPAKDERQSQAAQALAEPVAPGRPVARRACGT